MSSLTFASVAMKLFLYLPKNSPVDTGRKLNVLSTFNLHPVSTESTQRLRFFFSFFPRISIIVEGSCIYVKI